MNLQPTRTEHGALLVTCPNEAAQYRMMAAVIKIAPNASPSNTTSYDGLGGWCDGVPSGYHVEVALTKSGEILGADEQLRILTAACAKVNWEAVVLLNAQCVQYAFARTDPDAKIEISITTSDLISAARKATP